MKKRIALALILIVFSSVPVFCASLQYSAGLDNPFIGILQRNSNGQIDADLGVSMGLGIAYKRYFRGLVFNYGFDPARGDAFSPYWAIGTFALIYPYVGVGVDYAWNNGFYVGIGLIAASAIRYYPWPGSGLGPYGPFYGYVGPEIHGGIMF